MSNISHVYAGSTCFIFFQIFFKRIADCKKRIKLVPSYELKRYIVILMPFNLLLAAGEVNVTNEGYNEGGTGVSK
jgi:hypothetical protein